MDTRTDTSERCHCGCTSVTRTDHCTCCGCEQWETVCTHVCTHDTEGEGCETEQCMD